MSIEENRMHTVKYPSKDGVVHEFTYDQTKDFQVVTCSCEKELSVSINPEKVSVNHLSS